MHFYHNGRWWNDPNYCVEHESYKDEYETCECWAYMESLLAEQAHDQWKERDYA